MKSGCVKMHKRTKALSISPQVKAKVYERDGGCCILCGRKGNPEAHYISRAQSGLGIEQNIVTLCRDCHRRLDQTTERKELLKKVKAYLDLWYPDFSDDERKYKKW